MHRNVILLLFLDNEPMLQPEMVKKFKLVVLTGAGISQESGLKTFREMGGLWESYDVEEVASIGAWHRNPDLVLQFYNERRKALRNAEPNAGHFALVDLERDFDVQIITQNVDDLHERAGSSKILHLHGELNKVRSTINEEYVLTLEHWELNRGDLCPAGGQLRPHIVWFGEAVPAIEDAIPLVEQADALAIIGTSMVVYPAAGLVNYAPRGIPIFVVDPGEPGYSAVGTTYIRKKATKGVPELAELLRLHFGHSAAKK